MRPRPSKADHEIDRMICELRRVPEVERDYRVIVNAQIATLRALKRRLANG